MKKVIVGSTSAHKIEAVKEALLRLGVEAEVMGVETRSTVNEQPMGFEQMVDGAWSRVWGALYGQGGNYTTNPTAVGIENGLLYYCGITIDIAVVIVYCKGREYVATSSGVRFPDDSRVKSQLLGFKTTAGEIIAAELGGDKTDPHKTLTYGRVSRKEMLIEGVRLAFAQIPDLESI